MNMPSFELNSQDAKAGSGGSSRIDTTGKYKGVIKFAKYWESDGGAKFITVNFEDDSGQSASIRICTHSKAGDPTYGYKQIQAMMACMKIRNLTFQEQMVDDYDYESGQVQAMKRTVAKEMTGKKIGLALYRHDQTNQSGKDIFTMDIAAPFNYETEQVAQEVLDSQPAGKLSKIVLSMKDKDSRKNGYAQAGGDSGSYQESSSSDFEDDIPF